MANGIAAAMNAAGQFEVSVILERNSDGTSSKRVKVVCKNWVTPAHIGLWFSQEFSDREVLRDPGTEKWLAAISGAKQVIKQEFHT